MPGGQRTPLADRIRKFTRIDADGCWRWIGRINRDGYGHMGVRRDGKQHTVMAHRISYELAKGPIASGLHLDHLCRNRACVNPDHLEAVTCRENALRSPVTRASINAIKTHCPQGHPYDEENAYTWRGTRYCRACARRRTAARDARRKAEVA
jgi:hypothetical protein